MVRRPAAQHPPEALNNVELRAITGQPLQPQMGMSRSHLRQQGSTMPGRMINGDDDCGILTRRIGAGDVPEVRRKGHWQALLLALARLGFATRWLLQQAGRQGPGHHIECRHTIPLILVIPGPHGGTIPLHPKGGPSRRHQRKAGFVLAQQHAGPSLGFFFNEPVKG